ncbi:hypothetical protein IQ235_09195 [Oscillatoriales cyanobacterium LEGE 11467]|uniref:Uncharacterized protein n=1 Tax=Zarconia navalis LEGE 11467 TaxID=1828826 RepID=A0A928VV80_9CYAN|nr:hypothetical protein [Zarconia navalis]MBE9040954.1 hypothetical protein [Zarconia navalis LEGE 11467]
MAGTFEVIQWCLAILAGFLALINGIVAMSDGAIVPVILFALACAIVLPPLQPFIEEKFPFLRPEPLKIFLCVFLMAIAPFTFRNVLASWGDVRLCAVPESGVCTEDIRMFPRNTSTLQIATTPNWIAQKTAINLELTYIPEPGQVAIVQTQTTPLNVENGTAQIELPIENLPIGSYRLNLISENNDFPAEELEFTAWDSPGTIDSLQSLEPSAVTLAGLKLCHQMEELSNPMFEAWQCPVDESVFPSQMKAAIANVSLNNVRDQTNVTFIWRYLADGGKPVELKETKSVESNISSIVFTLASEDGFAPGKYEIMVYPESQNAQPIFRVFSVEA